jgi:subtilisin family serine protease
MATSKKGDGIAMGKDFPEILFAHASVHSIGGTNMFSANNINVFNVNAFQSENYLTQQAVLMLQAAGFTILSVTKFTISISGTITTFEKAFNTTLYSEELFTIKELGKEDTATYIRSTNSKIQGLIDVSNSSFKNVLEGVSINEPVYFMAPNPFAPKKSYWHLQLPGDVSLGLQADPVHRQGITGRGVNVAMVDTGWYRHPYFTARGYRSNPVQLGPGTINPANDEVGHGTGESANIFAIAPDVNFTMVKMSFVDSAGAFNRAVALRPHIITCSWGSSKQNGPLSASDLVLSAAIANAVANNITVIFSAGNGHWGFPGQHPDVVSAGGVYVDGNMQLRASDYASGFASNIYAGRNVPDVSGLVGMKPKASYIMLPIEPSDQIDTTLSGNVFPNGDETTNSDGWAAFSGTSAAAPQLAGVCALLKQFKPNLTPVQLKAILKKTAVDVKVGNANISTGGNPALVGPDLATGYGLVNAKAAIQYANQF